MMTMFNYTKRDSEYNDLIEETLAFAAAIIENKNLENREERLKNLNYGICQYCTKDTKVEKIFEKDGLQAMNNPMVKNNRDVQENFDAIIAQIINPILPMVSNRDFEGLFAETRQIGYGDTARFLVKSNELYKVNEIAHGVNRGILEPIKNSEFTVNASPVQIAFEVDFYELAAGVEDLADKAVRVARSFEQYIFLKILAAMATATANLGPAYSASGFTNANWTTLAQRTSVANGGSDVLAVGTLGGLNSVVPSVAGLQYGLGQKIADQGYLDRYLGTKLFCIDQAFGFGQVNTNGAFAIPDDLIYMIPVGSDRPIKIVYEGDSVYAQRDPDHTPDRTYRSLITYNVGVGVVLGSKFATLDI